MQNYRSIGSTAHPSIRDPYHILDPLSEELRRQPDIPELRHAWISFRTNIPQNEHRIFVNIQIWKINTFIEIFNTIKHDCFPGMPQ
ncbi:hypothetical protein D3C80_1814200 [compost metagenome]